IVYALTSRLGIADNTTLARTTRMQETTTSLIIEEPAFDDRKVLLIGNIVVNFTDWVDDAFRFAQKAIEDVNNNKEMFPLFKLKLDPCIPGENNIASVTSKLLDYVRKVKNTPFMFTPIVAQETIESLCGKWGCITYGMSDRIQYTGMNKYHTKVHAAASDCAF
ncbi:unnamed protein product, partial [Owenia fusiformis]